MLLREQGAQQRVLYFGLNGAEDAFFEDFFVGHRSKQISTLRTRASLLK
jgi:hypothetical protein